MLNERQTWDWRPPVAVALVVVAGLLALAGLLLALVAWAVMGTYPDDDPNTLLQNITPMLVYVLPTCGAALGLVLVARRLGPFRSPP